MDRIICNMDSDADDGGIPFSDNEIEISENDDSEDEILTCTPHPKIQLQRDPYFVERMRPKCCYISHPNVQLSRLRKYEHCVKPITMIPARIESPMKKAPSEADCKCKANCACQKSSIFESSKRGTNRKLYKRISGTEIKLNFFQDPSQDRDRAPPPNDHDSRRFHKNLHRRPRSGAKG